MMKKHTATSVMKQKCYNAGSKRLPGLVYFIPCPKSPHGCDVDPTGEYIVGSGKLAALIPVFSFTKMIKRQLLKRILMGIMMASR